MTEIIKTLITIVQGVIIVVIGNWLSCRHTPLLKKFHSIPQRNEGIKMESVHIPSTSRVRTSLVLLIEIIVISVVLYEVRQPGDLTRDALFKIAFGIGAFFFLLIQTTIVSAIRGLIEPGPPPDREKSDEK